MTTAMKIPINYTEASETLKKYLKLSGSPVAFRFATKKEDIPAGMQELDKTIRHCGMISLARKEGKIFFSTAGKHECNGGAWALGLRELTESLKTGTSITSWENSKVPLPVSGRLTVFRTSRPLKRTQHFMPPLKRHRLTRRLCLLSRLPGLC